MSLKTVTFEASEESIATLDEIATLRSMDHASIVRDALGLYLADYVSLKADLEEADRQIESGETVSHDHVVAWFNAQHTRDAEAA
jgi:predicted transcriptional regulator